MLVIDRRMYENGGLIFQPLPDGIGWDRLVEWVGDLAAILRPPEATWFTVKGNEVHSLGTKEPEAP